MKLLKFLLLVAICVTASCAGVAIMQKHQAAAGGTHETAYDRVIRTGVLRCGYGLWDPAVMRDPNTGQITGFIYDFMQEVGKALNVKVEYTMEMPWDTIGAALTSGKIDAHCAGIWATPARGRAMAFSEPLFFIPTVAFARADDNRFDNNLARMNQPDVTVAVSDDDITTEVFHNETPQAKAFTLAQFAPPEELLLSVMQHKADIAFNSPTRLESFAKGYPGKVKIIPLSRPLRMYPDTIAVGITEDGLLHMLNAAIDQLIDNGTMNKLVAKYGTQYDLSNVVPVNRLYTWKPKTEQPVKAAP